MEDTAHLADTSCRSCGCECGAEQSGQGSVGRAEQARVLVVSSNWELRWMAMVVCKGGPHTRVIRAANTGEQLVNRPHTTHLQRQHSPVRRLQPASSI